MKVRGGGGLEHQVCAQQHPHPPPFLCMPTPVICKGIYLLYRQTKSWTYQLYFFFFKRILKMTFLLVFKRLFLSLVVQCNKLIFCLSATGRIVLLAILHLNSFITLFVVYLNGFVMLFGTLMLYGFNMLFSSCYGGIRI